MISDQIRISEDFPQDLNTWQISKTKKLQVAVQKNTEGIWEESWVQKLMKLKPNSIKIMEKELSIKYFIMYYIILFGSVCVIPGHFKPLEL